MKIIINFRQAYYYIIGTILYYIYNLCIRMYIFYLHPKIIN